MSARTRHLQHEYERAEDRVIAQRRFLDGLNADQRIHFAPAARRKLERLEAESTAAFQALQQLHETELDLTACRNQSCDEKLTRHEAFRCGGYCQECFEVATGTRIPAGPTWGELHPPAINDNDD